MNNLFIGGLIIMLITPVYIYSRSTVRINSDDEQKKLIEEKAALLTSDLQSKIDLNDNQVSEVKTILTDYLTNVSLIHFTQRAGAREKTYDVKADPPSDLQDLNLNNEDNSLDDLKNADTEASSKLDNIITEAQKNKWKDVKDSWWNRVIAVQYTEN